MSPEQLPEDLSPPVAAIVAEVLRLDAGSQVRYIAQVCGVDRELRCQVERVLESLPQAEYWGDGAPFTMHPGAGDAGTAILEPSAPPVSPGARLSHYLVEERIGQGGMGEVFRARDLALGRPVAIKVLRGLVDPALRARFAREARAGARLEHAAVATFIEFAHVGGIDYLAMEFVEGETLRARLKRGAMTVDESLALVQTILEALVHAHALGILHRDIKPENIMLMPDGAVKLLDFGVAKDVGLAEAEEVVRETNAGTVLETKHGAVVGTPGYMAPEQLRGERVEASADLFALGAVLHECLTGRMAFAGENPRALMLAVLSQDPEPVQVGASSAQIQMILARALARDPAERYSTAREFLTELKQVAAGESIIVLPKSLALLDFDNIRDESEHDWIGSGVAESLAVDLGRVEDLEIVPRARVRQARAAMVAAGHDPDAAELGLAVRSRWVLAGSFQRVGDSLRMTARLVEVATARELWSEKLDGSLDTVLQMQDELAIRIAESLGVIVPASTGTRKAPALDAFECYQRALRMWGNFDRADVDDMMANLQRAIKLDPGYADALSLMASVYAPSRWVQTCDTVDLDHAIDYATRAIAVDPELASAHVARGYAYWRKGDINEAISAQKTAVRLDPSSMGNYFLGACYSELGQFEKALEASQQFHEISPAPFNLLILGFEHMQLGHSAEAGWALGEGVRVELSPDAFKWQGAMATLAELKRREGDLAEARADCMAALQWIERSDFFLRSSMRAVALVVLGRICLDQGDREAAHAAFDQAASLAIAQQRGVGIGHMRVQALAGLARVAGDQAMLDQAVDLFDERQQLNFGWIGLGSDVISTSELAAAATAVGDEDLADRYRSRSLALGMPEEFVG